MTVLRHPDIPNEAQTTAPRPLWKRLPAKQFHDFGNYQQTASRPCIVPQFVYVVPMCKDCGAA